MYWYVLYYCTVLGDSKPSLFISALLVPWCRLVYNLKHNALDVTSSSWFLSCLYSAQPSVDIPTVSSRFDLHHERTETQHFTTVDLSHLLKESRGPDDAAVRRPKALCLPLPSGGQRWGESDPGFLLSVIRTVLNMAGVRRAHMSLGITPPPPQGARVCRECSR